MNYLSPSILSADFGNLARDVSIAAQNGAEYIHIDVMDGMFVPNMSIGFTVIESLRKYCDKVFDVHLMIEKPERYVERYAKCGSDIITFHYEATDDVQNVIGIIHSCGKKAGISIKPATPVSEIEKYLNDIELVLIMTVEPGFGGQKFMPDMLEKIEQVYKYKVENGLDYDIEVDGGINLQNLPLVLSAGANVVVAGSSVFAKDMIAENTKAFVNALNSDGVANNG